MSAWRVQGTSSLAAGAVVRDDARDGVHRSTLAEPVVETATSRREARWRLADKLERIAAELRRDAT